MKTTWKLIAALGLALPLHGVLAQPFANASNSLAGYSRAVHTPGMA